MRAIFQGGPNDGNKVNNLPDLSKVTKWPEYISAQRENTDEMKSMHQEAREFLEFYDWCSGIKESYVGMLYPGIVAVFLYQNQGAEITLSKMLKILVELVIEVREQKRQMNFLINR